MNIIFLGAPGVGKGTHSDKVSKIFGIPTISTGVIIREAIKNGTALGIEAEKFIKKGELVSDDIVINIINDRLMQSDCENGFILDGFPRTVPQAIALEEMGKTIDRVISIEVPDEVIVERVSGRRVCAKCGATYHISHNPSKDGINCDICATELSVRKDDVPEVVATRLRVYHESTEPLKQYYLKKGIVKIIDGNGSVQQTFERTLSALGVEI